MVTAKHMDAFAEHGDTCHWVVDQAVCQCQDGNRGNGKRRPTSSRRCSMTQRRHVLLAPDQLTNRLDTSHQLCR